MTPRYLLGSRRGEEGEKGTAPRRRGNDKSYLPRREKIRHMNWGRGEEKEDAPAFSHERCE